MYVCVYICSAMLVCACMYAYIYIHIYIYVCVCNLMLDRSAQYTCMCMCVLIHWFLVTACSQAQDCGSRRGHASSGKKHASMRAHCFKLVYVCMCACIYWCMRACMYVCMSHLLVRSMHSCVRILYSCVFIYFYFHVCVYVCTAVYKLYSFIEPLQFHRAVTVS